MSVSTMPGATEFTVIPRGPSTLDRSRVKTSSAPFVIAYAINCGIAALWARPDDMFTTRPPSLSLRSPSWVMKCGAFTFTAKRRSYSPSSISSNGRLVPIPALFTRMSSPSACRSNSAHRRSASPATPSSAPMVKAEPPSASIPATVSLAAASLLP